MELAVRLAAISFYCTEVCVYRTLLGSTFRWVLKTPILSHQHSEMDSAVYKLPLRIPEKIPEKPAASRAAKLSPPHQLRSAAGATPFLFICAQPEGTVPSLRSFWNTVEDAVLQLICGTSPQTAMVRPFHARSFRDTTALFPKQQQSQASQPSNRGSFVRCMTD